MSEFLAVARRLLDLSEPLRLMGELAEKEIARGFAEERAPDETPWPELSERYARRKGGGTILTLDGVLKGSIRSEVSLETSSVAIGPDPQTVKEVHQKNENRPDLPARPFVGITEERIEPYCLILMGHIRGLTGTP